MIGWLTVNKFEERVTHSLLKPMVHVRSKALEEVTIAVIMAAKDVTLKGVNPSGNVGIQGMFRALVRLTNFVRVFLQSRMLSVDGQTVEHVMRTLPGWRKKRSNGRMSSEAGSTMAKSAIKEVVEGALTLVMGVVRKVRVPGTHDISWLKRMRRRCIHTEGSTMSSYLIEKRDKRLAYIRSRGRQD